MIFRQFLKFSGIGLFGTAVQYVTLFVLVQFGGIYPVLASTTGFVMGAFVNYHLNYTYTFKIEKSHFEAMPKFFSVAAVGMLLNGLIMELLISNLSLQYILAQLVATALVLFWNFTANRIWTFTENKS